jgi:hypothetical protein
MGTPRQQSESMLPPFAPKPKSVEEAISCREPSLWFVSRIPPFSSLSHPFIQRRIAYQKYRNSSVPKNKSFFDKYHSRVRSKPFRSFYHRLVSKVLGRFQKSLVHCADVSFSVHAVTSIEIPSIYNLGFIAT